MRRLFGLAIVLAAMITGGNLWAADNAAPARFRLVTLDPGHFHASLVQKSMYPDVDPVVQVYAPAGDDVQEHLKRIVGFNTRTNDPTRWREEVYTGKDYLAKMLADRTGNVVVIAGNNAQKTDYILKSVQAGFNVLADKPMVITPENFPKLEQAFKVAESNHVLLYDIMTERFEVTTELQRRLAQWQPLFGALQKGSPTNPGITMESVHYFSKTVAGSPLKRPQWFFDTRQEGEAMQDVGTHLVDLVQWEAFPEQALSPADVQVLSARRWATPITREQFKHVTGAEDFPDYLKGDVKGGGLQEFANGEINYRLRDVCVKVSARWEFETANGGDTHYSMMRGGLVNLVIRQGAAENYKPVLYVENVSQRSRLVLRARMDDAIQELRKDFPGVSAQEVTGTDPEKWGVWRVEVPAIYDVGHEAHFAQVTGNYLNYLREGKLPAWEVPNMLTKYATTMKAYEMSR